MSLAARLRTLVDRPDAGWHVVVEAIALTDKLRHPDANQRIRAAFGPTIASTEDLVNSLTADPDGNVGEVLVCAAASADPQVRTLATRLLRQRSAGSR